MLFILETEKQTRTPASATTDLFSICMDSSLLDSSFKHGLLPNFPLGSCLRPTHLVACGRTSFLSVAELWSCVHGPHLHSHLLLANVWYLLAGSYLQPLSVVSLEHLFFLPFYMQPGVGFTGQVVALDRHGPHSSWAIHGQL